MRLMVDSRVVDVRMGAVSVEVMTSLDCTHSHGCTRPRNATDTRPSRGIRLIYEETIANVLLTFRVNENRFLRIK